MENMPRVLAVITARGGSKGLPGKNIKLLCGKPLIAWTIESAKNSFCIDELIVSTDSDEIAAISQTYGAKVPFIRPQSLATDTTNSVDVILHAIEYYEKQNNFFDYVILLEPTSPLRKKNDLCRALQILKINESAESIVGVCIAENHHPSFAMILKNEFILPYNTCNQQIYHQSIRRQDLSKVFFLEGSLYISTVKALKIKQTFYHDRTLPFVVEKWQSFEIDDELDFKIIEKIFEIKRSEVTFDENM